MKKVLSVFVMLLCCVLFINIGKNIQQKAIITLVKSAITGQSYDFPKEFDLNELLAVAKKHNISSILLEQKQFLTEFI